MNLEELAAVPTEDVVRAQREMTIVTAALADLTPLPSRPQLIATRCDEPFVPEWAVEHLPTYDPEAPNWPQLLVLRDGGGTAEAEAWNNWLDSWKHRDYPRVIIKGESINSVIDVSLAFQTAKEIGANQVLFVFAAWSAPRGALTAIRQSEHRCNRPSPDRAVPFELDFAIAPRPVKDPYPLNCPAIERLFELEARKLAAYQAKGDTASLADFWHWIFDRRERDS